MNTEPTFKNVFRNRYKLSGRDWVRRVSAEDRQAFVQIGLSAAQYGHLGGIARAASAQRDRRGRFTGGQQ